MAVSQTQGLTAIITPVVKNKIEEVLNAFETGSAAGDYSEIVKYHDGPGGMQQVTYGRSQTTEFGNLNALIKQYVNAGGAFANVLAPYVNRVGQVPSLSNDAVFCNALINAAKTDPVMKTCQDDFFDSHYYLPAFGWFNVMGFTLPLSLLVIYDSFIHSGGILNSLRNQFPEAPPVKGGDEKTWIHEYVDVRNNWLAHSASTLLQKTTYRTQCLLQQIANNNWDLSLQINANGVKI